MMIALSQPFSEDELRYAALRAATKDGTEAFQPSGFVMGQIVDVYDGDTCRLAIIAPKMGIGDAEGATAVQYLRIRALGYDAPEMKLAHRPYGLEVKAVLEGLVLHRIVVAYIPTPKEDAHGYAVPEKPDPYGRTLAHLFVAPLGARLPRPRAPPYAAARGLPPPAPPAARGVAEWAGDVCACLCPCPWPGRPPFRGERGLSLAGAGPLSPETPAPPAAPGRPAPLSAPPRTVVVRGAQVSVPGTEDVPCGYGGSFGETARLLWVNGWMVAHARVKPYDGRSAREGYTDEELAEGYPLPPRPAGERRLRDPRGAPPAPDGPPGLRAAPASGGGGGPREGAAEEKRPEGPVPSSSPSFQPEGAA
jgi:endonuclease YncB( thermonuclease family)